MPLHVLERSLDVVDLPPPLFTGIRMTASRPEKAVAFALAFLLLGPHLVFPFEPFGVDLVVSGLALPRPHSNKKLVETRSY